MWRQGIGCWRCVLHRSNKTQCRGAITHKYCVSITLRYQFRVNVIDSSEPDSVSIALQVPMYVLITAGEIMFSITGLEFAYSQVSATCVSQTLSVTKFL